MKFSRIAEGQLSLVFSLCLLVSSCNPEEYYPVEELVEGADAYCAKATDRESCQQLADVCQPAYEPLELDLNEPVYATCVANPDMWNPVYDDPDAPTDPGTDPGTDPEEEDPSSAPSIEETVAQKCANLDPQYLWVKKEIKNKKVINEMKKVKICHIAGNSHSHTIVIACPALKAHVKHHDDYLGACEL